MGQRLHPGGDDGSRQPCEPAGAAFAETLDELNDVDRQLILFSASSNAAAVRWLLALGASRFACDRNGTTCLHAACRSGSLAIVELFLDLEEGVSLTSPSGGGGIVKNAGSAGGSLAAAADVAGWMPLHIAAFMGRCDVVERLLRHGAGPGRRTAAGGQTAAELCADPRTRAVLEAAASSGFGFGPGADGQSGGSELGSRRGEGLVEDDIFGGLVVESVTLGGGSSSRTGRTKHNQDVRFEPFFVPRNPAVKELRTSKTLKKQALSLGRAIFAQQPGRGLAFLVASGCVRDYPVDLAGVLSGSATDPWQVGIFLGEDFSLSKILRMEFMYSIGFMHCGVVSCLQKAFASFRAPYDLQKVDRILVSLADVWWRQHQRPGGVGGGDAYRTTPLDAAAAAATASALSGGAAAGDPEASEGSALDGSSGGAGGAGGAAAKDPEREVSGFELRRWLRSPSALQQLLFSAVMLHWNLHGPLPKSQRLDLNGWLALHRGLCGSSGRGFSAAAESGEGELPEAVLAPIYRRLRSVRIPNLWLGESEFGGSRADPEHSPEVPPPPAAQRGPRPPSLSELASEEGWARLCAKGGGAGGGGAALFGGLGGLDAGGLGTDLGRLGSCGAVGIAGGGGGAGGAQGQQLSASSIFSEATASSRRPPPPRPSSSSSPSAPPSLGGLGAGGRGALGGAGEGGPSSSAGGAGSAAATVGQVVWVSLAGAFLLLSSEPPPAPPPEGASGAGPGGAGGGGAAPFAFVHLREARVASSDSAKGAVILEGRSFLEGEEPPPGAATLAAASAAAAASSSPPTSPSATAAASSSSSSVPVQLVQLMPDGRWQTSNFPSLEIQVCDRSRFEGWTKHLHESCEAPLPTSGAMTMAV